MHVLDSAWETLKREFESASQETQTKARRQIAGELNRLFRRFRHYENEEAWLAAVRDGASLAAREHAIFTISNGELRLRAQQGLSIKEPFAINPGSANAFRSAIESREPLVALRRASEVGSALASDDSLSRLHVFPVVNSDRVVAIVVAADAPDFHADVLELITGMASVVLERQLNDTLYAQIMPARSVPLPEPPKTRRSLPSWAELSENDRRQHARAQRFARVAVARMQLAHPAACRAGREQNNVYMFLQAEIDKARENYAKQFMTVPSMVDYLHLELVQSMAEGEERKLGADYPGHLV